MALNPVGPQPRSVYWRRRLLLLLGLLMVVLVVSRACGTDEAVRATPTAAAGSEPLGATMDVPASAAAVPPGTGQGEAPSPATRSTSTAVVAKTPRPDATGTGAPAASAATPRAAAGTTTTTAATPAPTGSPTSATGEVATCADADVTVTAEADARSYPPGTTPRLTLTVRNVSPAACRRDLGSAALELVVTSGSADIWNSDACKPAGGSAVTTLAAGRSFVTRLSWPRVRSGSSCPTPRSTAEPGTYRVAGRAGTAHSAPAAFVLR